MDKFIIHGGKKLKGSVRVSGAKNASLALMPATLLTNGKNKLFNTPELNDVYTMLKLLSQLGVKSNFSNHLLELDTTQITSFEAPYEHVKKMRASIYVLGPLVAKYGYAKVSLPGGCAWGPRPVNLHLMAMEKLGADITLDQGYIIAKAKKLKGNYINFDIPSVGATGNTLMAAVLAKGHTIINNAASEPEITNLCNFLIKMGAKIDGVGTSIIEIEGVDELYPADIETIPDRIEAGTLLIAGAITKSNIKVLGAITAHLYSILSKLEDSGCKLFYNKEFIEINSENNEVKPVDVTTAVFPGFPTDMQAQWIAYMSLANGTSNVTDTIYRDRFNHVPELVRLGADIVVNENTARVVGVKKLIGAKVMSTDLRASASLVLAGLAAEGVTEVLRVYHIDRGYQKIEEKLKALGADIERVEGSEY
ncbi:MAG: UDP-N-acetylglucosamine 1-carboxyvinyltransferase [Ignavibacterium sp.]|uniref:UDP-N-acetylglucosamine 1-carboxyvinyltransferase n=1 Tax=Ignavibacterium sp. TaxID=2651167 RepID=UPI00404B73C4